MRTWFISESGFIPTTWMSWNRNSEMNQVLISFREWLHSYKSSVSSVSSDISRFSSLSESGFIPTKNQLRNKNGAPGSSHLFQRVASFLHCFSQRNARSSSGQFSSLSESGFIPTSQLSSSIPEDLQQVLISFREWLHSYFL